MNEKEKWVMDFTDYEEDDRDLMGIGQAILRVTLVLVILGSVYAFFLKTELSKPSTDIKSIELGILYSDGMNLEEEAIG